MPEQESLFDQGAAGTATRLGLPDADVVFLPLFFPSPDRDRLLEDLDETTVWHQESFRIYGKTVPLPRLTALYGDPGKAYTYSKIAMQPAEWTPPLVEIKTAVEQEAGVEFNGVLLNLYRDGQDSVAWHTDDESELGEQSTIASVSFGAVRRFQFRHRENAELRSELELTHGSLLVMSGETQRFWQHQVPKTSRKVGPRINLTFRHIG